MNTSDITNYIQKMEQLIQMQQIELDKTRNLLWRALDATEEQMITVDKKEYNVPDNISFDAAREHGAFTVWSIDIEAKVLPPPFKSMYEQITELKKELNL